MKMNALQNDMCAIYHHVTGTELQQFFPACRIYLLLRNAVKRTEKRTPLLDASIFFPLGSTDRASLMKTWFWGCKQQDKGALCAHEWWAKGKSKRMEVRGHKYSFLRLNLLNIAGYSLQGNVSESYHRWCVLCTHAYASAAAAGQKKGEKKKSWYNTLKSCGWMSVMCTAAACGSRVPAQWIKH